MTSHDLQRGTGPRADRPKRRTFTAAYKLQIVEEYDAAPDGTKGAILRREGLYESSISLWRRQRDNGELASATGPVNAPRARKTPEQLELERLRKENAALTRDKARAEKKLAQTEAALDIMGKGFALLEMISESAENEPS
ncbi:transposase (plasmid) [Nonomuraea sp. NBC_00507]|uniref:transposase n=1 Tax=Nonomuraea sp. NBC_00507 TaxID=2976002 RepID=UPI002E18CC87